MASQFSKVVKSKSPDWQAVDDASLDTWAREGLDTGRTAKVLKKRIPEWSALSDDEVNQWVRNKLGNAPAIPEDEIKRGIQERKVGIRNAESGQRVGEAKQTLQRSNAQTSTDATAKADAQQMLSYGRAPDEEAFVKEYLDFDEMMKANPGAVARSVYGEVQAQDPETGKALSQLRPGRAAPLSIYKDSKWFEPAMGLLGNVTDVTGKAAAKVYRGLQYPYLPPEARPREGEYENEGFGELLQNESGKFGKAFPQAAAVGGAIAALPAVGWNTLMVGKNKAEQALAEREIKRQEYLAKVNAEHPDWGWGRGPYNMERAQQDLATQKQDLAKEDKALDVSLAETQLPLKEGTRTPEEGADIGRNVLGKRLADIAGLVNPLQDVNLALKGIGMGGKALLATKTGKAIGRSAGEAAEALAEWSSKSAMPLSNFPAKVGAPEATRAGLESAQSLMREFPAMEERKILEQYSQLVTPEQAKKAIRSWHTPEARTMAVQADPAMANVFETLQPLHNRIALEAGIKPQDYSPFFVYGGQDTGKAARVGRSASQKDQFVEPVMNTLRKAGVDTADVKLGSARVDAAEPYIDVTNMDVPGLRSLRDKEELWNMLPTKDGAQFLPGARTSDSYAQRLANQVASELTKSDTARNASKLPGLTERWQKATGVLKDDYDLEKMVSDAWSGDAITGMAGTHRKLMERGPQRLALAREELLGGDYMVKAAREDFGDATMRPLSEWSGIVNQERLASGGSPMSMDTVPFLNAHGDVRTLLTDHKRVAEIAVPDDIRNRLISHDEVIIVPRGPAQTPGEAMRDYHMVNGRVLVMDLPEGAFGARREAMVVPRRVAAALDQLSSPNGQRGRELAKAIDHALGLSQAAFAVTRGNPGFDARNFQSNATRALIDEGPDFLSGANRAQSVRDLADPALRLEGEKLLGIGKDLGENAAAYGTRPSAPGLLPTVLRKPQEKAFNALQENFGGAINKRVDDALKGSFFMGAPAHYSADDMLRFHHWRTQVQRGVHPTVAAQNTNRLLINYADKSGAEALAKTFFPFIRFYTGAAQGAVLLALKEPYRFSRIWRFSQALQQADSDARGGKAVNAKAGSAVDTLVGTPMVGLDHLGMGDSALALRTENPLSETKAVFDAALGELAPGASAAMGTRPASLVHPGMLGAQSMFADFPVVDEFTKLNTGYAPLPVPNDVWSGLSYPSVPGKAYQVMKDSTPLDIPPDATPEQRSQLEEANRMRAGQAMRIADSPKAAVLYEALRRIPGVGPAVPVLMDTAMRLATGSGNVRGRTSEAREIGALRMLLRMLGPRSEGLDIQEMMGKKGSELERRRTRSTAENNQKAGTLY